MIELARSSTRRRARVRKRYEDEVEAPVDAGLGEDRRRRASPRYGTSVYPDATFTLRLNYGTVQGWNENGEPVDAVHAPGARSSSAPPAASRSRSRTAG